MEMQIKLRKVTVRELVENYEDRGDEGVFGYGGKLDIRPPYQRAFIYDAKERNAVIDTLRKKRPLNVMYWAKCSDGRFEVIDGQQRTISICQFVNNKFSHESSEGKFQFHSLPEDKQEDILNYELMVYECSGKDSDKLDWFQTINIAGKELTRQELRNAVYHGSWVAEAKKYFSKVGGAAQSVGGDYLSARVNRQEVLETAVRWINDDDVVGYMTEHQHDKDATELWGYFQSVIDWVKMSFPEYRREMKGLDWGSFYREHENRKSDPIKDEKRISKLMADSEVQSKKGIYAYILTGQRKHLNLRTFDDAQKRTAWERQGGICPGFPGKECGESFPIEEMEADHIKPWSKGGKTTDENCQVLCIDCNREKGAS